MNKSHLEALLGLDGRMAVVTGGASGIGAGISTLLALAGAHVVIADINAERSVEQVKELRCSGLEASAVSVDVSSDASIVAACQLSVAVIGAITRGHAACASSKSALMGLTNAAALELATAAAGIRTMD